MKRVIAMWDRCRVASKSRMTFVLFSNGDFMEVYPRTRYVGKDADDNSLYEDTGELAIIPEYNTIKYCDFMRADRYMRCFGGRLIYERGKRHDKEISTRTDG